MATTRSFNSMLNEYLPFELLREETIKRNYVLQNIQKDDQWRGGSLIVPFKGGHASSFRYGALSASNNVSEDQYVRGSVANYKELWGSMKFNARDLAEHNGGMGSSISGQVSEQSFLRILPDTLDDFMDRQKEVVSVNLLTGPHFATLTADGDTNGVGVADVDHPERFTLDQEVVLDDDAEAAGTFFVIAIDMNNKRVTLSATRGGAAASISIYATADNAKVYVQGAEVAADAFSSLADCFLSAANGGSATLYGETKLDYPFLQATNIDGSGIIASTILDEIFDAWTEVQKLGRGPGKQVCIMSYANLGAIMKLLQNDSGPFRFTESKANLFGWTELSVIGVRGELKLVGVHEQDDDKIYFVDWGSLKLCSNGMFRIQKSPEGLMYFTERATTGYTYIVDTVMFGEQICYKPSHNGVIHSVPSL